MSLTDKVVLVTGGAGGIGLAMVSAFLKNGVKAVSIVDISEGNSMEKLSKDFSSKQILFIKTDVTKEHDLVNAFDKTVEAFGNLDIVVNNAGIVDEINWEKSLNVLLVATIRSTYMALQEYLPKYKSGDEALIVNTASILGLNPTPNSPIYSLCKRGVITLSETLGTSKFYNKYHTKVITICPGVTVTPMINTDKKLILFPDDFEKEVLRWNKVQQQLSSNFLFSYWFKIV